CLRSQTFTYSAVDLCGNPVSDGVTYTWKEDLTAPSIVCTGDQVFSCTSGNVPTPTTAADNCDGTVPVTCTRSDGQGLTDPYPIGTTTVTCAAADACGNPASCSFTVTVNNCAEGCTPGFWKNHTSLWDEASDAVSDCVAEAIAVEAAANPTEPWAGDGTTGSSFRTTFGLTVVEMQDVALNPNLTLLQAINLGGGDFAKLARHGVAGLLSSCQVNYSFSSADVLQMVHDAIVSGLAEPTAQQLADANNLDHTFCETGHLPAAPIAAPVEKGSTVAPAKAAAGSLPTEFALRGSYPNPFNASTRINFALPQAGHVRMVIYNILGQPVRTLVEGEMPAGERSVLWDGTDRNGRTVSSGVYFYKVSFNGQVKVGRMNLLK
ncbi:MAG: T9SS type A sorting domain-containing protein, partial [candidate division Zixibacteria bacterium]|nr:T9SS type A sorting domain-containing protein [candidate division Zixibacteria bacterium]